MNGFSDGVESREVGEPGRRGPQEFGHLVVVVILELELIVLVLDQVLAAVVRVAVRRVDGVSGSGGGRGDDGPRSTGMVIVADRSVSHVLALDHVRPAAVAARVLRYPVVVYRPRADGLLGLLVRRRLILLHLQHSAHATVLFAVHGGSRADRVLLQLLVLFTVLLVLQLMRRRRVLGVRVRPDFALDYLADVLGRVVELLLLLLVLDRRKSLLRLAVGGPREECDGRDRDDQHHGRGRGARRHRSRLVCKNDRI